MKKWENRIEVIDARTDNTAQLKTILDMAGTEGWELVTIDFISKENKAFFKREKQE